VRTFAAVRAAARISNGQSIVTLRQNACVPHHVQDDPDELRSAAIVALLRAEPGSPPPRWLQMELLAAARRAAAADPAGFPAWLREQCRLGGVRESAALVAALQTASRGEAVAAYLQRHPERERLVLELLRWA
jgi:hypothetical protein